MQRNHDAYGHQIWAYFQGKESYEVVERDDGFVGLSQGAKAYFAEYQDWPEHQKIAIKFAKGRVLDIGSGSGRLALYLQDQGYDVTCIDNSALAIRVCNERGVKKAKVLPIEKIHQFAPDSFDTILMFGNNFGLFGGFKKAKSLLKKMHKITSSDALIIAESRDPYPTDKPAHLKYLAFNRKRDRMSGQLRIRIRFQEFIGKWFDYLLASRDEVQEILQGTGWRVKKFIDSEDSVYISVIERVER